MAEEREAARRPSRANLVLSVEEYGDRGLRALQKLRRGMIDQIEAIEGQLVGVDLAIGILRERFAPKRRRRAGTAS